jgi:hypothetical protein
MLTSFYYLDFDNYKSKINKYLINDLTNIVEEYINEKIIQVNELSHFLYFLRRANCIEPECYSIRTDNTSLPEANIIYSFAPKGNIIKFFYSKCDYILFICKCKYLFFYISSRGKI